MIGAAGADQLQLDAGEPGREDALVLKKETRVIVDALIGTARQRSFCELQRQRLADDAIGTSRACTGEGRPCPAGMQVQPQPLISKEQRVAARHAPSSIELGRVETAPGNV